MLVIVGRAFFSLSSPCVLMVRVSDMLRGLTQGQPFVDFRAKIG